MHPGTAGRDANCDHFGDLETPLRSQCGPLSSQHVILLLIDKYLSAIRVRCAMKSSDRVLAPVPWETIVAAKLFRFNELVNDRGQGPADVVPLITGKDSETFGMGFSVFSDCALDWELTYDEAIICLSGELTIVADGQTHTLAPKDAIWLPKGTKVKYVAQKAIAAAVYYPASPLS